MFDERLEREEVSEQSRKQEEAIAKPNSITIQKSQLKITEEESLPRGSRADVVRRLDFGDEGSEIKR